MCSVSLYRIVKPEQSTRQITCLMLPTERTSTCTAKCSHGGATATQGAGQAKKPNLPPWEQPREMFHVVGARESGLKGTQVLLIRDSSMVRGRWRSQGRCTLQCPEEREQMDKLANFVQKMGHDPGKMLDHHHPALAGMLNLAFTCFRQSCSLKKGTGSWPAGKVLFEPSLFQ